ncbi:hypothetical protein SAMN05216529_102407 [Faecalicatena contorta]|uniref:Uncharacterized protein n=1 Tax=Faecalicatena contorta TaxID=39482 RepID=A0A316A217_9FIRM|nr:hypothetical protein A8805_102407 [Faecalicatena contorta]SUQ13189.1 hypothetical protein SAMN05216529_102407 [Faecalicatena contorta]
MILSVVTYAQKIRAFITNNIQKLGLLGEKRNKQLTIMLEKSIM